MRLATDDCAAGCAAQSTRDQTAQTNRDKISRTDDVERQRGAGRRGLGRVVVAGALDQHRRQVERRQRLRKKQCVSDECPKTKHVVDLRHQRFDVGRQQRDGRRLLRRAGDGALRRTEHEQRIAATRNETFPRARTKTIGSNTESRSDAARAASAAPARGASPSQAHR